MAEGELVDELVSGLGLVLKLNKVAIHKTDHWQVWSTTPRCNVSNLFRTFTLFGQTLSFDIILENSEAFQPFLQKQTICAHPGRTIPSCTEVSIRKQGNYEVISRVGVTLYQARNLFLTNWTGVILKVWKLQNPSPLCKVKKLFSKCRITLAKKSMDYYKCFQCNLHVIKRI